MDAAGPIAPVPISGRNERRMIFGAINLRTDHRLMNVRTQRRVPDFRDFLRHLRRSYLARPLLLLLDQNPTHTHADSQALAAQLKIALEWLPKRSPHLNAMDHLWRDGKKMICGNRQMDSIVAQAEQFSTYRVGLSNADSLCKAGIRSENFWLKDYILNRPPTLGDHCS